MYTCYDYSCILLRGSLLLHGLLLHGYSCIYVTWLFLVPVIGHECCWYALCGTKCHVDLSHGGHLYNPTSLVFRFLFSCFMISTKLMSYYRIVPRTVIFLDTLCRLNIIKITWGWERLDGWLGLVEWMSWIHIYPTAGDDSTGY